MIDISCTKNTRGNGPALMAHIVAGYPDAEKSVSLAVAMAHAGVAALEVQFPFSDPLADGPTIMRANQKALDSGMTVSASFELAARVKKETKIPVYAMTYSNIPLSMGIGKFLDECERASLDGLIVPDLPHDEKYGDISLIVRSRSLHAIRVVSPGMSGQRLSAVLENADGFVYATLRVGVTGSRGSLDDTGMKFLSAIRALCDLPVAAGFGISAASQVSALAGHADIAVIGSKTIDVYDTYGERAAIEFIESLFEPPAPS